MSRQARIPGTEGPKRNKRIEDLAEAYVEVRNKRMKLTEKEVEARGLLESAMVEAGLTHYDSEDSDLIVDVLNKVKVRRRAAETGPEKE